MNDSRRFVACRRPGLPAHPVHAPAAHLRRRVHLQHHLHPRPVVKSAVRTQSSLAGPGLAREEVGRGATGPSYAKLGVERPKMRRREPKHSANQTPQACRGTASRCSGYRGCRGAKCWCARSTLLSSAGVRAGRWALAATHPSPRPWVLRRVVVVRGCAFLLLRQLCSVLLCCRCCPSGCLSAFSLVSCSLPVSLFPVLGALRSALSSWNAPRLSLLSCPWLATLTAVRCLGTVRPHQLAPLHSHPLSTRCLSIEPRPAHCRRPELPVDASDHSSHPRARCAPDKRC